MLTRHERLGTLLRLVKHPTQSHTRQVVPTSWTPQRLSLLFRCLARPWHRRHPTHSSSICVALRCVAAQCEGEAHLFAQLAEEKVALSLSGEHEAAESHVATYQVVVSPFVAVRARPSLTARLLCTLATDVHVEVEERRGKWVRLRTPEHGFCVDAGDKWVLTVHPLHGQLMRRLHVEYHGGAGF